MSSERLQKGVSRAVSRETLNAIEMRRVKRFTDDVMGVAGGFTDAVEFAERFELDDLRLELFEDYFAHYYLLKKGYDDNYLMSRPEWERYRKTPIVGRIASEMDSKNMCTQIAADKLMEEANSLAENLKLQTQGLVQKTITLLGQKKPQVTALIGEEKDDLTGEIADEIVRSSGSPRALQFAANDLSTAYLEWQNNKSKEKAPLREALEGPLSNLKLQW